MSVFLILLSGGISILAGIGLESTSEAGLGNFRAVYYGARCLITHNDPYQSTDFLRVYRAEGGEFPTNPVKSRLFLRAVPVCVNLPTTLVFVTPFAVLPWGPAHLLWLMLLAAAFILAGFLAWDISADVAPAASLFLICVLLANSEVLFAVGNTAGIAVSFCVIAVWCFLKERFAAVGVLCLAVSLAVKPHDSGLVWLYLVLAGGTFRKRALQTLAVTVVLAIPAVLWVSQATPDWMQELRANLAATAAHGDISDPGPASINSRSSADIMIDLQTVISEYRDDPRIYNLASYLVCGVLLLVWSVTTLRSPASVANAMFALASIAALSMLATYHRPYDAKLLLLGVPACALLWAEGGAVGKIALAVNTAAIVFTGDIPLAVLAISTRSLNVPAMGMFEKTMSVALIRPAPIALLAMTIFYSWVYLRRSRASSRIVEGAHPFDVPVSSN